MHPRSLAVGLLVLALALAWAAPVASAASTGIAYLPPAVHISMPWQKVVYESTVSVPANSTESIAIAQYVSGIKGVQAIKVIVKDANGSVTLKALDASGNVLAQADVVPLSSGFEVTFPADTANISIENLAGTTQVWQGQITIVVQSGIEIYIEFLQPQIVVKDGKGSVPALIKVHNLPAAGSVSLSDYSTEFEVFFTDPNDVDGDGKTLNDNYIYLQPYSGSQPQTYNVSVNVTTSAKPGTYTVRVVMYFHEGTNLASSNPIAIGSFDLSAVISADGDGGDTTTTTDEQAISEEWVKWGLIGLGALVLIAIFMGGRR